MAKKKKSRFSAKVERCIQKVKKQKSKKKVNPFAVCQASINKTKKKKKVSK